jgi:predicted DNA repair protein MutK
MNHGAKALEDAKVRSAIQTDFILSAEIMAITLANVEASSIVEQAFVLFVVGVGVTAGVYGLVALIVKADDVGVALARNDRPVSSLVETILRRERGEERGALDRALAPLSQAFGRGLVRFVPKLLTILAAVGTAAMLWVGGGILLHGVEHFGWHAPLDWLRGVGHAAAQTLPGFEAAIVWLVEALGAAVIGIVAGAIVAPLAKAASALARRVRRAEPASG